MKQVLCRPDKVVSGILKHKSCKLLGPDRHEWKAKNNLITTELFRKQNRACSPNDKLDLKLLILSRLIGQ